MLSLYGLFLSALLGAHPWWDVFLVGFCSRARRLTDLLDLLLPDLLVRCDGSMASHAAVC